MPEKALDSDRKVPHLVYGEFLPFGHFVVLPVFDEDDQLLSVDDFLNERQWTILEQWQHQALKMIKNSMTEK